MRGDRFRRGLPLAVVLPVALLGATRAGAQEQPAAAQFDYGLAEMLAGRFDTGCPALQASYGLDPRPGTLFTLAECNAKWGKTASALSDYEQYLAQYDRMSAEQKQRQAEREKVALQQRNTLSRVVPRLAVTLPASAPSGTVLKRDGAVVGGPLAGVLVPVDPGEHVLRVETPDGRATEKRIAVADGEQLRVEAPIQEPTAATPSSAPAANAAPSTVPPARAMPAATTATSTAGPWQTIGIVLAGAGVVALGVGSVFGADSIAKHSDAERACPGATCPDAGGASLWHDTVTAGNVSTVGFIVGSVALVGGAVLWLGAPRSSSAGTQVGVSPGAVQLRGAW